MREIPKDKILIYVGAVAVMALAAPLLHRVKRTRGKRWLWHVIYLGVVAATLLLMPASIQDEIFSPGGVVVLGTLWPVYSSIRAITSIGEVDDTTWLQFWVTSATLSFSTEWMDSITTVLPAAGEHWYEFEFFFNLWLILPFTDGATLIYDNFTKPYISPIAQKITDKCEGYIGVLLTVVNTSYIWFVWFAFMRLPEEARRFIVVLLGTIYPIAASTVAITTEQTGLDDTMWLTYWCSFSLLFLAMDYIENFIGHIPGFYSLIALATLYLFLPMFQGAKAVFRNVLVPLTGQYERMLLHDAYLVKAGMEKNIPKEQKDDVFLRTAQIFLKSKAE